jgi:hypothetical protein
MFLRAVIVVFSWALASCASNVPLTTPVDAQTISGKLSFIDVAKFDRDLASAMVQKNDVTEVSFYEKVSPNSVPERLQKWLAVVEAKGGKVLIEPPPNEFVSRSPFAALSLVGSLITTIKSLAHFNTEKIYDAANGRDAVISLQRNNKGEVVVNTIKFVKRTP